MAGNTKGAVGKTAMWDRLAKTDPKATKPYDNGRFKGTQIDPVWRYYRMTEEFGMHGKGWGYEQLDWTVTEQMVFVCVRCWYLDPEDGEIKYTGPQWGGDVLFKTSRNGPPKPNDEAFKMAMTDAIGKALVPLGMAADIYMGQFDDSKYKELVSLFYETKAEWPDEKIGKFEADTISDIGQIGTVADIDGYYKNADFREALRCIGIVDKKAKDRVMDALSDRKRELVEAEEANRRAEKTGKGQPKAETADEPEDTGETGEHPGYEGSIQQQADRDQAEFYEQEEQRQEQPEEQQQAEPEERQKPKQEVVIDVTEHIKGQPKTLAVQEPDEEQPDWERFARTALKIIEKFPSRAWGERWMKLNSFVIGKLEEQGVIMERDGVEYTGLQAAKWIDKAYDKRMKATPDGGTRRAEQAGAN